MPNMTSARDNLGPLVTPFTYPSTCTSAFLDCSTCSDAWQAQTCSDNGTQDDSDCWPPPINGNLLTSVPIFGGGFYSPGISCPVGYVSACSATGGGHTSYSFQYDLLEAETAIGCCPSGYTCGYISVATGKYNKVQTCLSMISTGQFSAIQCHGSTTILTQQTIPATVAVSVTATTSYVTAYVIVQTMTIKAPLFQIIHKSTDLPKSTSTIITTPTSQPGTSLATGAKAGSTSTLITTPTSQSGNSLSTGAKAGIGVGAAAGGLVLIGAAIFMLFWRHKMAQRPFRLIAGGSHELAIDASKAELPPGHAILEAGAPKVYLPLAELG
ncbi:hypothetical protein BGW36DRAFT_386601 [Talaromyces proteolyticus]|uniref:Uncharacterized protein n=1 Tax=Talaromyces proteolyticus TaxID=1131652 RepID=A0AAD4PVZ3_9EURO|nr:uncharacterized protein BGW36DRAFT_386601 [Talaromyces proteolyticus]KAH8691948.1 hypothetical protein BGW36DRAFT_386601 [Talaromyces proteolyticus]